MKRATYLLALLAVSAPSHASPVTVFLNEIAPVDIVPVVASMSVGQYPNNYHYADPATGYGLTLGAYFSGQTTGSITPTPPTQPPGAATLTYETVTGLPTSNTPLTLLSQGENHNLQADDFGFMVFGGLLDTPDQAHGAVSILFDAGVDVFGLDLIGANVTPDLGVNEPGKVYFQFFGANGALIDSKAVTAFDGSLWFQATGTSFRGVTITTDDYQGIAYYNLRFTPTPPVLALMLLGLGALRLSRRSLD
jgi:hypothetical protein